MKELFTALSLVMSLFCSIAILKRPDVDFDGWNMGPVTRVVAVLVAINLVGVALTQLAWIGKFLLLPLQFLLDTVFGTSLW